MGRGARPLQAVVFNSLAPLNSPLTSPLPTHPPLQFSTLFVRSVRVRRFETLSQQDLAQFLSVAAVCGMIWWQVGQSDTVYGAQNTMGLLFFEGELCAPPAAPPPRACNAACDGPTRSRAATLLSGCSQKNRR